MPQKTKMATVSCREGEGSVETLERAIRDKLGEAPPKLITVFAGPRLPLDELCAGMKAKFPTATVLGASALGEFNESSETQGGTSACAIAGDLAAVATLATGIKGDAEGTVAKCIDALKLEAVADYPYKTAILLIDGLAGRGEETTLLASLQLGPDVRVVGGCAGEDFSWGATAVAFDNQAAKTDGLVVAVLGTRVPLGIAVDHGMAPISPPLQVTKSEANVVYELEGRPAWTVWRELTRERALAVGLDPDKLDAPGAVNTYLSHFQLGLSSANPTDALKIRWPSGVTPEGGISFTTGIPVGAVVRISYGSHESHIGSAARAAAEARTRSGRALAGALVFDCGIRKVTLGARFGEAVQGIVKALGGVPVAGFETYGEVSLEPGDFSGFHNTSTVVVAFPE